MAAILDYIKVEKLFGYVDFTITKENLVNEHIFYIFAENGMGKTTLLNMIFSLLSCRGNEGNKNYLSKQKFRLFEIGLRDGTKLKAHRESLEDQEYTIELYAGEVIKESTLVRLAASNLVTFESSPGLETFLESAKKVVPDLVYINANRAIRHYKKFVNSHSAFQRYFDGDRGNTNKPLHQVLSEYQKYIVITQVDSFNEWLRRQTYRTQTAGIRGSSAVFATVLRNLIADKNTRSPRSKSKTLDEIEKMTALSSQVFKYGLAKEREIEKIRELIEGVPDDSWQDVQSIANLYYDSTNKRFSSLINLANQLDELLTDLNGYFSHKSFKYDVQNGLRVFNNINNEPLEVGSLSSGERQLLILFSLIAVTPNTHTLFLIDEPEISLSTIWQRRFSGTITKASNQSKSQFLIATHSLEILSDHVDQVSRPTVNG